MSTVLLDLEKFRPERSSVKYGTNGITMQYEPYIDLEGKISKSEIITSTGKNKKKKYTRHVTIWNGEDIEKSKTDDKLIIKNLTGILKLHVDLRVRADHICMYMAGTNHILSVICRSSTSHLTKVIMHSPVSELVDKPFLDEIDYSTYGCRLSDLSAINEGFFDAR